MDAVETLLRSDGAALLTLARCWLGSGPAALEAMADAVATVGRRRDSVVDGPALRAAVLTTAIDRLARMPQCDEETLGHVLPSYAADGTRVARPGEHVVAVDTPAGRAMIRAAIPCVPVPFRQALLLVDMEGWQCSKAAARLGVTETVLKRRLHVARMALTTLLQRRGQEAMAAA
jgi:DNA-directed RNA polymerase specialized sigma24 family protein